MRMKMRMTTVVIYYRGIRQPGAKAKGFTLIETLVSLVLIALAILLIAKVIVCAFDGHKKSRIRLNVSQELEFCKNQLLSKSFDSDELKVGSYSKKENHIKKNWQIKSITPTLKIIHLVISYKGLTKRVYFYKSKYIKNNEITSNK